MSLRLSHAPSPWTKGPREVRVFGRWTLACAHLCDHVLSLPEAAAWEVLLARTGEEIIPRNSIVRPLLASEYWEYDKQGAAAQRLYDRFCAVVEENLDPGKKLQNSGEIEGDRWAFGLDGLYIGARGAAVRTAYIAGFATLMARQGDRPEDEEDWCRRRQNQPLPRNERGRWRAIPPKRENRHRIYRKSALFVRRKLSATYSRTGSLPAQPLPVLSYEDWLKHQRGTDHEQAS